MSMKSSQLILLDKGRVISDIWAAVTHAEDGFPKMPIAVSSAIPGCQNAGEKVGLCGRQGAHLLSLMLLRRASERLCCLWNTGEGLECMVAWN
jgi:hypothetical protein